jgi:hypothetical protein
MSLLVDNPILNSPFEEPTRYWAYEEGQPVLVEGRRPAGYYFKSRTRGEQLAMLEEEFVPLELVNTIRERVREWRMQGYLGVTPVTRQLLNHWNTPERERKLFFCQREAVETLIWLVEASPARKQGIVVPKDSPSSPPPWTGEEPALPPRPRGGSGWGRLPPRPRGGSGWGQVSPATPARWRQAAARRS